MIKVGEVFEDLFYEYKDRLYRAAYIYVKNAKDSEKLVTYVFTQLYQYQGEFNSKENLKNWLYQNLLRLAEGYRKYKCIKRKDYNHTFDISSDAGKLSRDFYKLKYLNGIANYLYYIENYNEKEILLLINKKHFNVQQALNVAYNNLRLNFNEDDKLTLIQMASCGLVLNEQDSLRILQSIKEECFSTVELNSEKNINKTISYNNDGNMHYRSSYSKCYNNAYS